MTSKDDPKDRAWGDANLGREDDNWAPGQMADGEIVVLTPEEARKAVIERDAEEAAFTEMLEE